MLLQKKVFLGFISSIFYILISCSQVAVQKDDSFQGKMEEKGMKIWSKHFKNGDVIPSEFTCDGKDISPALEWSGVPGDAKSLALVVDDPDAPAGLWVHWILINISSYSSKIPSNGPLPMGAEEIRNDFGNTNYGGPCPPGGIHRYFFRLYALNIAKLEGVTRSNYADMIKNHTIAYAEYMGKYKRKQ